MSLIRNARYVFTQVPTSFPVDGKHFKYDGSPTMNLESVLLDGGVLLKTLALSVHPFLRGRMLSPETKSPVPTFKLGEAMFTHGVGVVLRSEDRDFAPGDHVVHAAMPLQEYSIAKAGPALQKIPRDAGVPWSDYIGVLGMPGMTAYTSWKEFARPQKGQTAFVSSAAGPVGSVVVQLAKLDGLKVIASSGSDEKVHFTNECGADVSFNYKTTSTDEVLAKEGPIDIYFDCVGGETLDLALKHAAQGATFIECGMVSLYNEEEKAHSYQNMMNIVGKSISLHGFVYVNLLPKWGAQFFAEMPKLVQEGKMKSQGHPSYGLDKFGEAFVQMQKGANIGKTFVVVAED